MKLLNHDLYDLYALFIFLRAQSHAFPRYREGIRQILSLIETPEQSSTGMNRIRQCLRPFHVPEDIQLNWVLVDNASAADVRIMKEQDFCPLLAAMLRELLAHGDEPDRLYRLCDSLHNIPLILAGSPHPVNQICREIEPYQETYAPDFLRQELTAIR